MSANRKVSRIAKISETYHLNLFTWNVPPLKEKKQDVLHLFGNTRIHTLGPPDQIQELIKMNAPPATTIEKRCHFLKPNVHEKKSLHHLIGSSSPAFFRVCFHPRWWFLNKNRIKIFECLGITGTSRDTVCSGGWPHGNTFHNIIHA